MWRRGRQREKVKVNAVSGSMCGWERDGEGRQGERFSGKQPKEEHRAESKQKPTSNLVPVCMLAATCIQMKACPLCIPL